MKGIQYIIDDNGEKTAVIIDLKEHQEIWEDFLDIMTAEVRANEPRISLEEVEKELL